MIDEALPLPGIIIGILILRPLKGDYSRDPNTNALERDYDRDPNSKALKRRGCINQGSTLLRPAGSLPGRPALACCWMLYFPGLLLRNLN